jgi:hypothetical protein
MRFLPESTLQEELCKRYVTPGSVFARSRPAAFSAATPPPHPRSPAHRNAPPGTAPPLKDNKGNVVITKTLGLYDPVLWQTNYLLDGIVGSIT